jgi:anti-sigma factor RsiW
MLCKKIRKILMTDYLDGRFGGKEARLISEHLAGCPGCRELEKGLQEQRAAFREAGLVKPPEQVWRNIREAIVSERLAEENRAADGLFERLKRLLRHPRPVFAITGTLTAAILIVIFFSAASMNRQYAAKENGQILADYGINGESENLLSGLGTDVEKYFL